MLQGSSRVPPTIEVVRQRRLIVDAKVRMIRTVAQFGCFLIIASDRIPDARKWLYAAHVPTVKAKVHRVGKGVRSIWSHVLVPNPT